MIDGEMIFWIILAVIFFGNSSIPSNRRGGVIRFNNRPTSKRPVRPPAPGTPPPTQKH